MSLVPELPRTTWREGWRRLPWRTRWVYAPSVVVSAGLTVQTFATDGLIAGALLAVLTAFGAVSLLAQLDEARRPDVDEARALAEQAGATAARAAAARDHARAEARKWRELALDQGAALRRARASEATLRRRLTDRDHRS